MDKQIIYAYTAGIIDGEGTITLTKIHSSNEFRYPVVSVSSTTYSFLEYLKLHFGGTITPIKVKSNCKPAWHWVLRGNKVISLLSNIQPYLLEPNKLYRANLIIENYTKLTPRNGKYTDELRKAKHDFENNFFLN